MMDGERQSQRPLGWGYLAFTESESLHNHGIDVQPVSATDGACKLRMF